MMNLEGKKSVTRNGVEYPVMWVWDVNATKRLAIVVQQDQKLVVAVTEGDEIEFGDGDNANYVNWDKCEPQKEPTYRPYNDEEMKGLVGEVFKSKQFADIGILTGVSGLLAYLLNDTESNLRLLEYYTHKDGSPCGVLED